MIQADAMFRLAARLMLAVAISVAFVLVPGIVKAEDCALSPGASVVFGQDTCPVDPGEFAVTPDDLQPPTLTSSDGSLQPLDPATDDTTTPDGQWDWPAPTGDDADPN